MIPHTLVLKPGLRDPQRLQRLLVLGQALGRGPAPGPARGDEGDPARLGHLRRGHAGAVGCRRAAALLPLQGGRSGELTLDRRLAPAADRLPRAICQLTPRRRGAEGYSAGSVRGRPKRLKTPESVKPVSAEMRSPSSVSTVSTLAWETRAVGVGDVGRDRRLGVGAGRDEAHRPSRPVAEYRLEEGGDRLVTLVLERQWRHRQPRVLGQQRDDPGEVAGFPGVGEGRHELALRGSTPGSEPRRARSADARPCARGHA